MKTITLLRGGLCLVALLEASCGTTRSIVGTDPATHRGAGSPSARLFTGLGSYHRPISVDSLQAQQFFDQGMVWTQAFNHDEAIRSFEEAARLDPDCAIAWWGVALCHGPHINNPAVPEGRAEAAWKALENARARLSHASDIERELIEALTHRYAWPQPEDRGELDRAYADAMRRVWQAHPDDPDVGYLFAEAMMDLTPWDYWSPEGQPHPGTVEILASLDRVLELNPDHPGALHLLIHAVEASPNPERGMAAADRLRRLVPGAGHLVHMPAHIDVRTGRWTDAADANVRAAAADAAYRSLSPDQGFYRVYMAHNHHFLAYAAMMEGRPEVALRAARAMVAGVPESFVIDSGPLVDPVMSIVLDVEKRFGMWDAILAEPAPHVNLPITTAMWRADRAIAQAAKGDTEAADREYRLFVAARNAIPEGAMMTANPASTVLGLADSLVRAEIALAKDDPDTSITLLREAAIVEDSLNYMEPPDWIQPIRHTLGAVLVGEGRYDEAEVVYREDLARWPENGWSLMGLAQCLEHRGDPESKQVRARLGKVWKRSEIKPATTCLCVPSAGK